MKAAPAENPPQLVGNISIHELSKKIGGISLIVLIACFFVILRSRRKKISRTAGDLDVETVARPKT